MADEQEDLAGNKSEFVKAGCSKKIPNADSYSPAAGFYCPRAEGCTRPRREILRGEGRRGEGGR